MDLERFNLILSHIDVNLRQVKQTLHPLSVEIAWLCDSNPLCVAV
jgi:hypothetical protein